MSYRSLLKAVGKRERPPSLKPSRFLQENSKNAEEDLCVECGNAVPREDSFVCEDCAAKISLADIREEINSIRNRLLLSK